MLKVILEALYVFPLQYGGLFDRSCHDKYVFKLNIRVQRYKKVCKLRAMGALKVTEGWRFFTFRASQSVRYLVSFKEF